MQKDRHPNRLMHSQHALLMLFSTAKDHVHYIGSLWEVCLLLTYLSQKVFFGKDVGWKFLVNQEWIIKWKSSIQASLEYSCLLFPISAQALMNRGKSVMAFILFTKEKEKQQKEIILIGLFW